MTHVYPKSCCLTGLEIDLRHLETDLPSPSPQVHSMVGLVIPPESFANQPYEPGARAPPQQTPPRSNPKHEAGLAVIRLVSSALGHHKALRWSFLRIPHTCTLPESTDAPHVLRVPPVDDMIIMSERTVSRLVSFTALSATLTFRSNSDYSESLRSCLA